MAKLTAKHNAEVLAKASELDLARMAAFIDAEGSISINAVKKNSSGVNSGYSISVAIGNVSIPLIAWLKRTFGGSVYRKVQMRPLIRATKPFYMWQVYGRSATQILNAVKRHMIIKAEQAEIAIAFVELPSLRIARGVMATPERIAERELLRNRLKEIHKRADAPVDPATLQ